MYERTYVCMLEVPLGYTLRRHKGGEDVQLYSFLNLSVTWKWAVSITPWPI